MLYKLIAFDIKTVASNTKKYGVWVLQIIENTLAKPRTPPTRIQTSA